MPLMPVLLLFAAATVQTSPVRIGLCTSSDLPLAKAVGFQYAELAVRNFATMPDDKFAAFVAEMKQSGLPTPVANGFIPAEIKLTGPTIDKDKQLAYVRTAFSRATKLGIKIIVLGSGAARHVPDGFPKADAFTQLVDFAKRIAPEAKKHGIVIAVEPLRKQESNIINTAAEGLEWVKAVGHPHFQLMIDFYHLASEGEHPDIVLRAAKAIRHIHIANPEGRVYPRSASEADYNRFFVNLKKIGYRGGISVEAKAPKGLNEDGPIAVKFLREAYAAAQAAK